MKAVFLTLLAINVLYFGWRLWIVPASAPPAFVEAENVPRLVLVGEDPAAVQAALNPSQRNVVTTGREPASSGGPAAARDPRDPAAAGEALGSGGQPASPDAARQDKPVAGAGTVASGVRSKPVASGSRPADTGPATSGTRRVAPDSQANTAAQRGDSAREPSPSEVAVSLGERSCVSLGPFLNLREATEATAKLNEVGLSPSQRLAQSQVWFGHWVHLPSLPSRAAAVEIVEGLRAQGISDIYIEPSGPFVNSISLGVFSDSAHAETRAGQIRKLGISPQIRDRYRDSSVYWVDFDLRPDQVIDPADYQASPSRVLRLEGRACPAPG